jgi:hypothetical protein
MILPRAFSENTRRLLRVGKLQRAQFKGRRLVGQLQSKTSGSISLRLRFT